LKLKKIARNLSVSYVNAMSYRILLFQTARTFFITPEKAPKSTIGLRPTQKLITYVEGYKKR